MKIAIGTTRLPKVEGVKEALKHCPYIENSGSIIYILEKVESNVSDMPLSLEEVMRGAKNRARNLKKANIEADFYVGLEGGTTTVGNKKYLGGVVYVENKKSEGHYGFSAMIEVPPLIEERLYKNGEDLGPLMGELSGKTNIRSEEGAIGAWSNDMFRRKEEFRTAFVAAISPFYNKYYKL